MAEERRDSCGHGVCRAPEGLDARTSAVGSVWFAVWCSCMQLAMCTVIKPVFLKPIIQDRWAVSQISHASRGNSRGLVLRSHAGCYMHVPMALAM